MGFQNILIAFNGGEGSQKALDVALDMAGQSDAHLTGVLAHGASEVTRRIPGWLSTSLKSSLTDIMAARVEEVASAFRTATKGRLPESRLHWIDMRAEPDQGVSRLARLYDLTVIGRYQNISGADEIVLHPDRIAYASGRPILLVPRGAVPGAMMSDTAVVAWDGGRHAARAFFDALPLLRGRKRVILATIEQRRTRNLRDGSDGLLNVLRRYGLPLEHRMLPDHGSTADSLLSLCRQEHAAPLVIGSDDHSRWSEDHFDGLTHELAGKTEIPIFISY